MIKESEGNAFKAGSVAVVGVPNAGKSSLINVLLGAKLSIVSRKAQTTRHKILGIYTDDACQITLLDTPGFQLRHKSMLNSTMNRSVSSSLTEVDLVLFVIEPGDIQDDDRKLIRMFPSDVPVVCAFLETMLSFAPSSTLIKLDFPAFGTPTTATAPALNALPSDSFVISGIGSGLNGYDEFKVPNLGRSVRRFVQQLACCVLALRQLY
jgi:small GTP-binding protein